MSESATIALAMLSSFMGMAWIALAMEVHWSQVHPTRRLTPTRAFALRVLGAAALSFSLLLCLRVDHVSMAVLVWIMSLVPAAIIIALAFAWRPRVLAWLAP